MHLVPLSIPAKSVQLNRPISEEDHEHVDGAVVRRFTVREGDILITVWKDRVHEVIYQTPKKFFVSRIIRNRALYKFYGEGKSWEKDWPVDFGTSRRRSDGKYRALYARLCDYNTFRTTEFNDTQRDKKWPQRDA